MVRRSSTPEFIAKAELKHGNTYSYDKVVYKNNRTHVIVTCNIHSDFLVTPSHHLSGTGCPKCGIKKQVTARTMTRTEFIRQANLKHNNTYTYENFNYVNAHVKSMITCVIHGDFPCTANQHLRDSGCGCPKCGIIKRTKSQTMSKSEFIKKANITHNKRYTYENFEYKNNKTNGLVTCKTHGDFLIKPGNHLSGHGCRKCSISKNSKDQTMSKFEFIIKAKLKHGNKYSYDNVVYKNNHTHIIVTCKKHGDFPITPGNHLRDRGCPICRLSKGELEIIRLLTENEITFVRQKRFEECKDKRALLFDFYLPYFYILIEFDGEQHFRAVDCFGGEEGYKDIQRRDKIKDDFCKKKRIPLVRIPYNKNIEQCLKDAGIL